MDTPNEFNHITFTNKDYDFFQDVYDGLYKAGELICCLTLPCLAFGEERSESEIYNAILENPVLAIGMAAVAQRERDYIAKLNLDIHRDDQIIEVLKTLSNIETILSKKG